MVMAACNNHGGSRDDNHCNGCDDGHYSGCNSGHGSSVGNSHDGDGCNCNIFGHGIEIFLLI